MAKLPTVPLLGIEAVSVDVVVDVAAAMTPKTIPVGLPEAAGVENLEVIPVASLAEAAAFFAGRLTIAPSPSRLQELFQSHSNCAEDHADVRGQESAKRALVIAATGAHDLLIFEPI